MFVVVVEGKMLGMYILFSLDECVCSLRLQRRKEVPHHGWLVGNGRGLNVHW